MNRDQDNPDDIERTLGVVALAASSPGERGECPSDSVLAQFLDGALIGAERDRLMVHLDACPDCYEVWQMYSPQAEELHLEGGAAAAPSPSSGTVIESNLTQWLRRFLQELVWSPRFAIPGVGIAVALLVIGVLSGDSKHELARDGQIAAIAPSQGTALARELSRALGDSTLAFQPTQTSPERLAVRAGAWRGWRELAGTLALAPPQMALQQTEDAFDGGPLAELGHWLVLIWTAAQAESNAHDWPAEISYAASLKARLQELPDGASTEGASLIKQGIGAVDRMNSAIDGIVTNGPPAPAGAAALKLLQSLAY